LSSIELRDTRLEEGGELNVEGMWKAQHKRSVSSQIQKPKKKGKFPPFFAFFFPYVFFFCFLLEKKKKPSSSSFTFLYPTYLPPSYLPPTYLPLLSFYVLLLQ
jgi:hypothetical protein